MTMLRTKVKTFSLVVALLLLFQDGHSSKTCPPDGYDAIDQLDATNFFQGRWYAIKQQDVAFQPADQFYCVTADYEIKKSLIPFDRRPRVAIVNSAREGSVTGPLNSFKFLQGLQTYPKTHPARFRVAIKFFPNFLLPKTTYWIVAAGTINESGLIDTTATTDYTWAIVTAGRPNKDGSNGKCIPKSGMWLLSRTPTLANPVTLGLIEAEAEILGLDILEWMTVDQEGCPES